jgi:hypothetical protein
VEDPVRFPARYLLFLNLLIFGDISVFFVKIFKEEGRARTNNAHPRVSNRITHYNKAYSIWLPGDPLSQ